MSEAFPALKRAAARPLRWVARGINLPLAAGAAAVAIFGLRAGPYDLRLLTVAGIYGLLVIGFQFVFGYAGAVSLAQSCFFGVGAYVTAVLGATYGLETTITLPLSIVAAGALAAAMALPVMKLDDNYFALATLAVSLLVELGATQWTDMTGGMNGLSGIPSFQLFGIPVTGRFDTMLLVWGVVALGALLAVQGTRGLYGRAFHLMRESLPVASAMGLDVARMRFVAFVASGLYGGAAGSMMAAVVHVVSPELLGLPLMITCLTMSVLGGRLSVAGAIAGALAITYVRESFRALETFTLIAYGGVTLACLIIAPNGLVGALERLRLRLLPERAALPTALREPGPGRIHTEPDEPETAVALLVVDGVGKSFGGVRALDDVSLRVVAGEVVGLIGPNGSGKTTLLNVITGLYVPDAGRVVLRGTDTAGLPPFRVSRLGIARTFQHIHLVDDMSVLDNVALGLAGPRRAGPLRALLAVGRDDGLAAARQAAMGAAAMLGITNDLATPCGALAYGTRRRVEVARALVAAPRLLLLDEPAAGFNEDEQRDLARRIRTIADSGITVVVVEHNLVFLGAIAERLVCLDRGRIIADGLPHTVRGNPAVIEAYLGDGL